MGSSGKKGIGKIIVYRWGNATLHMAGSVLY